MYLLLNPIKAFFRHRHCQLRFGLHRLPNYYSRGQYLLNGWSPLNTNPIADIVILSPYYPYTKSLSFSVSTRHFSSDSSSDKEIAEARSWLESFSPSAIPRNSCIVTFSRSSGPGGQNVNKTNSKATLKLNVGDSKRTSFINPLVLQCLKQSNSRYLSKDRSEVIIQSDTFRTQSANIDECFKKLYDLIVQSANLPGETSVEQSQKVNELKRIETERRIKNKKHHSSKKASRRGDNY